MLHEVFKTHETIITIEDASVIGGFGSAIAEFSAEHNYHNTLIIKGIPDQFIEHGTILELQQSIELDPISLSLFLKKMAD